MDKKIFVTFLFFLIINIGFTQTSDKSDFDICMPEDLLNGMFETGFDTEKTYFGLYQNGRFDCSLLKLESYDSTHTSSDGTSYNYQYFKNTKTPQFIVSGNSLNQNNKLAGSDLKSKMLFIGDKIDFRIDNIGYLLYAKGTPILGKNVNDPPVVSIKDYEVVLRKIDGDSVREQSLLKFDQIDRYSWWERITPSVSFEWIGDLNQDGGLDIILITSNHHECWTIMYFQSVQSDSSKLVVEIFTQDLCS